MSERPLDREMAEMLGYAVPVTNKEFLKTIFGDDWKRAHVCSFPQDPIDKDTPRKVWRGGHASRMLPWFKPGENQYVTISTFHLNEKGEDRRLKDFFEATHCIVADDVREKLPVELVEKLPPPTWKMWTSPGSQQWGWKLTTPATERQQVENLLDGLVKRGLAPDSKDPGMKGVTRYVRQPEGSNTKKKHIKANGGTAPGCWVEEWHPERTVTLEELAAPFGIDLDTPRRDAQHGTLTDLPDHPVLAWLNVKARLAQGKYDVTCPWAYSDKEDEGHTDGVDDGAAVFIGADGFVGFQCHHGHCEDLTGADLMEHLEAEAPDVHAAYLKYMEERWVDIAMEGFEPVPEQTPEERIARLMERLVTPEEINTLEPLPDIVEKIVPQEEVTLKGGHGGVGKSVALLVLLVCVAAGKMYGDLVTRQCAVLFYSAEDGRRILAARMRRICRVLKVDYEEIRSRLHLLDMTDIDPVLFREKPTRLIEDLAGVAQRLGVGLVAIDNSSDTYDDNENVRARVRAFIRALRAKVARPGRAVILLAHLDKNSARGDAKGKENYSGSTAWHNSVRSRLSLTEADGSLQLSHDKANYGPKAAPIRLDWVDGVPVPRGVCFDDCLEDFGELERLKEDQDRAAILALITDLHRLGEKVNTARTGAYSAFKILSPRPGFPYRLSKDKFDNLLFDMLRKGELVRATVRTPNRKDCDVFIPAAPMPAAEQVKDTPIGGEAAA